MTTVLCRSIAARLAISCVLVTLGGGPAQATPIRGLQDVDPAVDRYEYLSPVPGSERVSPWNTIVFREGSLIDAGSLRDATLRVTGVTSGEHAGRLTLAADGQTIIFTPHQPFIRGETVFVSFGGHVRTRRGEGLVPLSYEFTVAAADPRAQPRPTLAQLMPGVGLPESMPGTLDPTAGGGEAPCDLPSSLPAFSVPISDHPEPGEVFLSPFRANPNQPGHMMIVDNWGVPVFYQRFPAAVLDFKRQPNGRLTYFCCYPPVDGRQQFYALDETYTVVDSFATGNGYITDLHELQLLPNGHALLMSYDPQPVRMDLLVPHGDPDAEVTGLIIQEIDADKNVVFQWRSWDHFEITDVNSPAVPITGCCIDYSHGNAIAPDLDGNILVSSRNMNEITKIDRATGDILWRLGLHARNNQFTFENDTRGFFHQHDIRRLPNGHITLYDNGNFQNPEYSRALEYELDEVQMHARLVWEFRNTPDTFGPFMGSVQRHATGNTMVGWGWNNNPNVIEVHADGSKAFELRFAEPTWSYRALRFAWKTTLIATDLESIDFGIVSIGRPAVRALVVRNPSAADLVIDCIVTTGGPFTVEAPVPATLGPGESLTANVTFDPAAVGDAAGKLYVRVIDPEQLIAQGVELSGVGANQPPDVSRAVALPDELWPPNHDFVPVGIGGITDPDGDPVTIEVTSVTHDEGVGSAPDPSCPDAMLTDALARVRAERDGQGNGRVYRLSFVARDAHGGATEGAVTVCVPHDRGGYGQATDCVDDGQTADALGRCGVRSQMAETKVQGAAALELHCVREGDGIAIVRFELPNDANIRLSLFDLSGRLVRRLDRSWRSAGSHEIVWKTTGLVPGVYFYRLRLEGQTVTTTVLIL